MDVIVRHAAPAKFNSRFPGRAIRIPRHCSGGVLDLSRSDRSRRVPVASSPRESLPDVITSGISRKSGSEIYDNQLSAAISRARGHAAGGFSASFNGRRSRSSKMIGEIRIGFSRSQVETSGDSRASSHRWKLRRNHLLFTCMYDSLFLQSAPFASDWRAFNGKEVERNSGFISQSMSINAGELSQGGNCLVVDRINRRNESQALLITQFTRRLHGTITSAIRGLISA